MEAVGGNLEQKWTEKQTCTNPVAIDDAWTIPLDKSVQTEKKNKFSPRDPPHCSKQKDAADTAPVTSDHRIHLKGNIHSDKEHTENDRDLRPISELTKNSALWIVRTGDAA